MESRNLGNKTKMIKLMSNVGNYGLIILTVIDSREWVIVLDVHIFKLVVFNGHLHCTILLIYENYRCSPRDTLGQIYLFLIKFYNYNLSSTNSGVLIRYGNFEA